MCFFSDARCWFISYIYPLNKFLDCFFCFFLAVKQEWEVMCNTWWTHDLGHSHTVRFLWVYNQCTALVKANCNIFVSFCVHTKKWIRKKKNEKQLVWSWPENDWTPTFDNKRKFYTQWLLLFTCSYQRFARILVHQIHCNSIPLVLGIHGTCTSRRAQDRYASFPQLLGNMLSKYSHFTWLWPCHRHCHLVRWE